MAIPHPKQHSKAPKKTEEIHAPVERPFENALFAILGAISALVVGLAMYGDFPTPFRHQAADSRTPASVTSESITIQTEPTEFYQQAPNGR